MKKYWFPDCVSILVPRLVPGENTLAPRLPQQVKKCSHYVDDTFAYVKNESINYVVTTLNSFHPKINFNFEIKKNKQKNSQLPFSYVLFIRNGTHLIATV